MISVNKGHGNTYKPVRLHAWGTYKEIVIYSYYLLQDAFQHLVRNEIKRLEGPALHCAQLVDCIMMETIENSMNSPKVLPTVTRFPSLKEAIGDVAEELLRGRMEIATAKIQDHIDILSTFIKTYNGDFSKTLQELAKDMNVEQPHVPKSMILNGPDDAINGGAVESEEPKPAEAAEPGKRDSGNPFEESEEMEKNTAKKYEIVRKLVDQFFRHECKNLQDYVPRSLVQTVIYFTQDNIQTHLVREGISVWIAIHKIRTACYICIHIA
jgi:hypothetical protein